MSLPRPALLLDTRKPSVSSAAREKTWRWPVLLGVSAGVHISFFAWLSHAEPPPVRAPTRLETVPLTLTERPAPPKPQQPVTPPAAPARAQARAAAPRRLQQFSMPRPPPVVETPAPPAPPAVVETVKSASPTAVVLPEASAEAAGGSLRTVTDAPTGPVKADVNTPVVKAKGVTGADLSGYSAGLHGIIAKQQQYPQQARRLKLEGTVVVRVNIARDGSIVGEPQVVTSSQYTLLDREAVRMVLAAAPYPSLPNGADASAPFEIPIRFSLVR